MVWYFWWWCMYELISLAKQHTRYKITTSQVRGETIYCGLWWRYRIVGLLRYRYRGTSLSKCLYAVHHYSLTIMAAFRVPAYLAHAAGPHISVTSLFHVLISTWSCVCHTSGRISVTWLNIDRWCFRFECARSCRFTKLYTGIRH